jgi:hypothetical protein
MEDSGEASFGLRFQRNEFPLEAKRSAGQGSLDAFGETTRFLLPLPCGELFGISSKLP